MVNSKKILLVFMALGFIKESTSMVIIEDMSKLGLSIASLAVGCYMSHLSYKNHFLSQTREKSSEELPSAIVGNYRLKRAAEYKKRRNQMAVGASVLFIAGAYGLSRSFKLLEACV